MIALKVGRTERSKSMVTAHSGALAGEDGAYEALFEAYGVVRVATLDEMADAMELFSSPRRVTTGGGIASIHDSGGERVLFVDVAADLGVPFAQISEATTARIQEALDPGLEAANPLDAWGTGIDADRIFIECFHALHDDPDVAALAFVVDMTRQGEPFDAGLPARGARRVRLDHEAVLHRVEPGERRRERRGGARARRRYPGARGNGVRA